VPGPGPGRAGPGRHRHAGRLHRRRERQLLLVHPGVAHTVTITNNDPYHYTVVYEDPMSITVSSGQTKYWNAIIDDNDV
jgi:hypothetical protein